MSRPDLRNSSPARVGSARPAAALLSLALLTAVAAPRPGLAQTDVAPEATSIVRDGSIGPTSQIQPRAIVSESGRITILVDESLGARPGGGQNLFHSFERFDLGAGDRALFRADPARATANVIARVTGGRASNVRGALTSDIPGANLFLLNPAGVLLGPGAALEVDGSVHLTTASSLVFEDGSEWAVDGTRGTPLLSVAPPHAFGFGRSPGAVVVRDTSLGVPLGRSLSLLGGRVDVDSAFVRAEGGAITLIGVGPTSLVPISDREVRDSRLAGGGSVRVSSALLGVSGARAGAIRIEGGSIDLLDSALLADSFDLAPGLGIDLRASDGLRIRAAVLSSNGAGSPVRIHGSTVRIEQDSSIVAELGGMGTGGDLHIAGDDISISDAFVRREVSGDGVGGGIFLTSGGAVEIRSSDVFTETSALAGGVGGRVAISGAEVTVRDGSRVGTRTTGSGDAGDVSVRGRTIEVLRAGLGSEATLGSSGRTGDVRVEAGALSLVEALPIGARSAGTGASGDVELAADRLTAQFSLLLNSTTTAPTGDLRITTDHLDGDRFDISSVAEAGGRSGDIEIRAGRIDYTGVISSQSPQGPAGDIVIESAVARIGPGPALILSGADPAFQSGNIVLRVGDLQLLNAFVSAGDRSGLLGGDVRVESDELLLDGATLSARSEVAVDTRLLRARAGSVIGSESGFPLLAEDRPGGVREADVPTVDAGAVRITADRIELDSGSRISSTTFSDGRAGDVTVQAGEIVLRRGASIDSRSTGRRGDAGTLRVEADHLALDSGARIATSTNGPGNAGRIELDVAGSLVLRGGPDPLADPAAIGPTEISSSALPDASFVSLPLSGDAGKISVRAGELRVSAGAQVTSSSLGTGRAGAISLDAEVLALDRATVATDAARGPLPGSAADGNVRLAGSSSLTLTSSEVSASVETGQGGDVDLETKGVLVVRDGSRVLARTQQGNGGKIRLSSAIVLQDAESEISADAGVGRAGTIEVDAPEIELDPELASLEIAYSDPADRIRPSCELRPDDPGRLTVAPRQRDDPIAMLARTTLGDDDARSPSWSSPPRGDTPPVSARRPALAGPLEHGRQLALQARAALAAGRADDVRALLARASERLEHAEPGRERSIVRLQIANTHMRLAASGSSYGSSSTHGWGPLHKSALLASHSLLLEVVREASGRRDEPMLAVAYGVLGRAYRADQRLEEALYLTRQAVRAASHGADESSIFRWHHQEGELLWQLDRVDGALAAYRRAVDALDRVRAGASLASEREARVRAFQRDERPVYLDLADVLLRRAASAERSGDDATPYLIEARSTLERFKAAELRNYFRDDCAAELEARTAPLDEVAGGAAVVYPIALHDRIELLVRLPSGLRRFDVPITSSELETQARQLRETAQDRLTRAYLRPARHLYDWLVAPYAAELASEGVDTLVFVPDASLRTVPLAALHDGERYLAERYAIAVTPGLSLVDPKPLRRDGARVLLAGVSEAVQSFEALPYVPRELEGIRALFGGKLLLDGAFSAQTLDAAVAADRPSVLHVASHVVFTGDPERSFVLTHDSKLGLDQLARIVRQTRFRADPLELLVLSACRTAVDDPNAGLGLAGIAVRSGARSAVGSLWDLSDEASSELIVAFYRALREPGRSRAEALREAQRALLVDPELSHPFYWSGFVLVNTWL